MVRGIVRCAIAIGGVAMLPAPLEAQWVLSAYGGAVHTQSADVRVEQPSDGTSLLFPDARFESRSSESPIYYGYRVAHKLPRVTWLFLEAELIHGKLYVQSPERTLGGGVRHGVSASRVPFAAVVEEFALSHGLNFILVNALMRGAVYGERVTATARLGAGAMLPHAESVVRGQRREQYELAGAGLHLSGGAEVTVWRRLAVTAEYKWTRARPHVTLAAGSLALTATSHHLAIGLGARF